MSPQKRLLIIDDEPTILEVLNEFFGSRYDVVTTSDPAKAMLLAIQRPFDVILLDINMPGMTGLELAAAIRAQGGRAPLLFMTGYPSRRDAEEIHRLGAVACLEKPTDLLELDRIVAQSACNQAVLS
jgi:CheY-like chemotaxis protein